MTYSPSWECFPCIVTLRSRIDPNETYTVRHGVARAWDGSFVYDETGTELDGTPFGGDVVQSTIL